MIIVHAQQIRKYHAANLILEGATFQLRDTDKVALIGRNGTGKSTLLRIVSGLETIDEGSLAVKKELRIGYLPQIPTEFERMTVYEVLAHGFLALFRLKQEMTELEARMAGEEAASDPVLLDGLLAAYTDVQERFESGGGYEMDTTIDQVASGLQLNRNEDNRLFRSLSGGEKSRVALASQLVTRPDLLLLDEPTNHLDLKGIEWLENYLQKFEGACLIVSHDRYFLDKVSKLTIELEDGEAHLYHTSYSGYVKEKEERMLQQFALYQEQQKKIKQMNEAIRQLEEWGRNGDNEQFFKRAASIRKVLERMEKLKRPVLDRKTAPFAIQSQERSGNRVIEFEQLSKRFGERVLLENAEGSVLYGEKVALIGDNGTGKSTLFKLILGEAEPDAGRIKQGTRLTIGYLAQQEPIARPKQTILEYFRTEGAYEEGEARRALARYLFYGAEVFKPLQSLSGGEWSRLRLALLIRKKPNLLLLDEPTNHLDIASREALEEALEDYEGTVLAISHDRYFINRLAGRVWELKQGGLASYIGNFDDYARQRQNAAAPKEASLSLAKRSPAKRDLHAAGSQTHLRSGAKLEEEVRDLEERLRAMDESLDEISKTGDGSELATAWQKREELKVMLDERIEKWLELES